MKLIKLGTLAVAAAVALGAYSAQAVHLVTTNYSKLNVSLIITTNDAVVISGTTHKYSTSTTKIGNKQLLDLFAHWDSITLGYSTNWPVGAQLVVGWNYPGSGTNDVLVVDKTGTNILYDASAATSHYCTVDFFDDMGAAKGTYVEALPGSKKLTSYNGASFYLYDDDYYLDFTGLDLYGGSQQTFSQTWDVHNNGLKWSDKESAKFLDQGDEYYLNFGDEITVSGSVSASGKGKGYNLIGAAAP
jgi:hypothetical protein